jgi:hypothetical protein
MKCSLCGKEILDYSTEINHMEGCGSCGAEICQDCIDSMVKWQGKKMAKLFPTKAMKRFQKS